MKKILLIEDDPVSAVMVQSMLSNNYEVHWAKSIADSMALENYSRITAVLSDFNLLDGTALNFLNFLNDKKIDLPVIIFSKFTDNNLMQSCWDLGAFDFIEKPASKKILLDLIEIAEAYPPPYRKNHHFIDKMNEFEERYIFDYNKFMDVMDRDLKNAKNILNIAVNELELSLSALKTVVVCDDPNKKYEIKFYLHRLDGIFQSVYAGECMRAIEALTKAIERGETFLLSDLNQLNQYVEILVDKIKNKL